VVNSSPSPDQATVSILQLLECPALEELAIKHFPNPQLLQCHQFILRCEIYNSLTSLHLRFCDGFEPNNGEEDRLLHILLILRLLRRLEIHGAMSTGSLSILAIIEDDEFPCCPKLGDVEIGGLTGNVSSYRNFVTTRWNIPGRIIKSMVFWNCKGIGARRT